MLQTIFFVPSNNVKFIEKSKSLNADYFVFDFEDAILDSEFDNCIRNVSLLDVKDNYLVRFRFFDDSFQLNTVALSRFIELGFKTFVIPKFKTAEQLIMIKSYLSAKRIENDIQFVVLVESPMGLLNLFDTLTKNIIPIIGVGLGSHDYSNEIGMVHNEHNLYFAKQMILNCAKALGVLAIDTVSININSDEEFKLECLLGFQMGFDGKFIIHPRQLNLINQVKYYSDEEVFEAQNVYSQVLDIQKGVTALVKENGKVYEKPHINRIINIINWKKKHGI